MSLYCTVSEIIRYWSKIADLNLPTCIWRPRWRWLLLEFCRYLWRRKTKSPWRWHWRKQRHTVCVCNRMFSGFGRTPTCDGQTDMPPQHIPH